MSDLVPVNHLMCPEGDYYFEIGVNPGLDCEAEVKPKYRLDVGSKDEVFVIPGGIGIVTFKCEDNFTAGIICHEALHMATSYMRIFESQFLVLGEDIDDNEERLAWLTGWFAKELTNYYYDVIKGGI